MNEEIEEIRESKKTRRPLWPRFVRFVRNLLLVFFIGSVVWVVLGRFIPVYATPLMGIRVVESLVDGKMPKV
ncbi:MAG TPA: hypothetical protein VK152_01565, partial [Paludibacter sp.]|nr:hypothetical protein [Paludibacter sp.]